MYERKGLINFVLIGAKSTGKTQYLKYLNNRPEISAEDSNTIEYLESLTDNKATNISYTELFFNYKDDKYNIEFQIDDYDGNFMETLHTDENSDYKEKLVEYIKESEGIFLFLPYEKEDTEIKFKNMQRETDIFIKKIKEEYGETHDKLPIPIVICVTKWDQSPYFKSDDDDIKAKEYIENNEILKLIKDKVLLHFKSVKIIPLSSQKNYNILKPIQISLDYTFEYWENKINNLLENDKKEELLIFLDNIMYDIKFYKNGYYKKLYEDIEKEVSQKYLNEIENIKNLKEFNEYYEEYKDILMSLSEESQEIIDKKRKSLENANKSKKMLISGAIILLLAGGGYFYLKNAEKNSENKLYNSILIQEKKHNDLGVMKSIKEYYKDYKNLNKEHYKKIKEIEESIKAKYREQFKNIENSNYIVAQYNSISKLYDIAKNLSFNSNELNQITNEYNKIKRLKNEYDEVSNEINNLSLDNLTKTKLDDINSKLNELQEYSETPQLRDILNQKIENIINIALQNGDENQISNILDIASSLNISDDTLNQLQEKLQQLKIADEFKEFKENLSNIDDIDRKISYIKTNWKSEWNDEQRMQIVQIINDNFNSIVKQKLNYSSGDIESWDDMQKIKKSIKEIDDIKNRIASSEFKLDSSLSIENKKEYDRQIDEYNKYNNILKNGVEITSFSFFAPKNNDLKFSCNDDKDLIIYINGDLYYNSDVEDSCQDNKIFYNGAIPYEVGIYKIKFYNNLHYTSWFDEKYNSSFTITKNDLIKLANGNPVSFDIGNGYQITLEK
jgi:hypothetical protein